MCGGLFPTAFVMLAGAPAPARFRNAASFGLTSAAHSGRGRGGAVVAPLPSSLSPPAPPFINLCPCSFICVRVFKFIILSSHCLIISFLNMLRYILSLPLYMVLDIRLFIYYINITVSDS